jgi:hypothetical protein
MTQVYTICIFPECFNFTKFLQCLTYVSSAVKRHEHEADDSSPFSTKVTNSGAIPYMYQICYKYIYIYLN